MAIFDRNDTVQRWKYIVKFLKVTFAGKGTIDIPPERVSVFEIEENFEEYYFPLIKMQVILDSDTCFDIVKNKNNCKINLRVDKFYYEDEDNKERSIPKKFINDMFELIMDDSKEDMYNSVKEDENKTDYKTRKKDITKDLDKVDNKLTFYLFKSTISGTKKNVNKLLTGCNVADAVVYLATVAGINNILMAQPDNNSRYNELLLPPLSILRSLEFIDLYYGLYKQGSMIYFGLDYTYIMPYSGKCTVYHKGEITTTNIIIPKSTNVNHKNILGSLKKRNDKKRNYIIADCSALNIENQSISNNYIDANSIEAVDSYEASTTSTVSKAVTKTKNFIKFMENKTMNTFYTSMYAALSEGKSTVVSLRLQDFDITTITPNKEFNLIFEDPMYTKKYNGKYLIAGVNHSLLSEGEYMGVSSTIILRKME